MTLRSCGPLSSPLAHRPPPPPGPLSSRDFLQRVSPLARSLGSTSCLVVRWEWGCCADTSSHALSFWEHLLCVRLWARTVCQDLGLCVSICCVSGSEMLMGPTVCPDLGCRVSCVLGPGCCVDM